MGIPAQTVSLPPPSLERLLQDWHGALARAAAYLRELGASEQERARLARRAVERAVQEAPPATDASGATPQVIDALTRMLLESHPVAGAQAGGPDGREAAFERWRLAAWWAGGLPAGGAARLEPPPRLEPAPPLRRGSMAPERRAGRVLGQRRRGPRKPRGGAGDPPASAPAPASGRRPWGRAARARHALLTLLVLIPSLIAAGFMLQVLPYQGRSGLELAIALFFGALFGWISIGFWTGVFGFAVLVRGDRFAIAGGAAPAGPLDPEARTAIVMPIFEEPVDRVFAGLRAIRRSLERAGALAHFDFFMLSDSADPAVWVQEEEAWAAWRREAGEDARIFYRRRRVRLKRKSGNVADFCRRWGRLYRYMVVLDADSVMSGEALVRLVRLMEANPSAGIVQSAPAVVQARSLFGRVQQFSNRVYGPLFAAGMHFWQLGSCPYWGHNAIIRIAPFMEHCGLPRLWGRPPLGGDIMSHDFVEAALLGRAGWSVWLAFDLPGTYEEGPGSLLEEMQRDRRWCQGNLQHLRLLFTGGLHAAHRALFLNGVFSYVSALLWLVFLALSTTKVIEGAVREPDYFPSGPGLFPEWPVWRPDWALSLLAVTVAILFLPKLLAALLILAKRNARAFGGSFALLGSVGLEILSSALFAPIRMVFYCKFVLKNLAGRAVTWRTGEAVRETGWKEAFRRHGLDTAVAAAWAVGVFTLSPDFFWWLTPVAAALVLSVPLSVLASREDLGERARRWGLFLTVDETAPPPEVRDLEAQLGRVRRPPARWADGFVRAVADPYTNAIHCALLRGLRSLAPSVRAARRALAEKALAEGPHALAAGERRVLLSDLAQLRALHRGVWQLEDAVRTRRWGIEPADVG